MGKFKPTPDNRYGRIARRAADIIDERGWTQGREIDRETGQVCLLGAARLAISPIPYFAQDEIVCDLSTRFGTWMTEHYPEIENIPFRSAFWPSMPMWNDSVFTSKEETVGWLRKFADDMDPQKV